MSQTVDEIRRKIDTMDNTIHDLLMQRAELVLKIGEEKRKNNVQVVQPDREVIMIRRLLARHKGPLPKEAVVRIWRELVGAVSLLQTGLKVVVTVPEDASGLIYWDMAKDYFSSVLPMSKVANPLAALAMVREGEATFAIMPKPADGDNNPWWSFLLDESGDKPMRIVARLPLGDRNRSDVNALHQGFVVARLRFDGSGEDRSFIILELEQSVSRAKIVDKIKEAGLETRTFNTYAPKGRPKTLHLIEVDKYITPEDKRLAEIVEKLDPAGRAVTVGGYPVPPVYEDKVGKSAESAEAKSAKKSA